MSLYWSIAIGLVAGVMAYGSAYIYDKIRQVINKRNADAQMSFHNDDDKFNKVHRNLTCPFCDKVVKKNDQNLPCGHKCHANCYQNRTAIRYCSFCNQEGKDANNELFSQATGKRSQQSNNSDIRQRKVLVDQQKQSPDSNVEKCCYCGDLLYLREATQTQCSHLAHKSCEANLSHVIKCQVCLEQ